jgi:hypothetical protein
MDFIQKVRGVIAELEAWDEDDLFYRRWYELLHDRKALSSFVQGFDIGSLREQNLLIPEDFEHNKNGFIATGSPV